MEDSGFAFGHVHALFYKCHKISLNRGRSYIDSLQWSNEKKFRINPKTHDNMCSCGAERLEQVKRITKQLFSVFCFYQVMVK